MILSAIGVLCAFGHCEYGKVGDACKDCAYGTYYHWTGSEGACVSCPAGQFRGAPAAAVCGDTHPYLLQYYNKQTRKLGGWYCYTDNNFVGSGAVCSCTCEGCEPGQQSCSHSKCVTPVPGKGSLDAAELSKFNISTSYQGCVHCPAGHYAPADGMIKCEPCPAGTYQPITGQTNCLYCNGNDGKVGQTTCNTCGPGKPWGHVPVVTNNVNMWDNPDHINLSNCESMVYDSLPSMSGTDGYAKPNQ